MTERSTPSLNPEAGPEPADGIPWYMTAPVQNRQQAAERLSGCLEEVRALGVVRLALFGSVLRGQPGPDSDVEKHRMSFEPRDYLRHIPEPTGYH